MMGDLGRITLMVAKRPQEHFVGDMEAGLNTTVYPVKDHILPPEHAPRRSISAVNLMKRE
jgi:hypothetical protein